MTKKATVRARLPFLYLLLGLLLQVAGYGASLATVFVAVIVVELYYGL